MSQKLKLTGFGEIFSCEDGTTLAINNKMTLLTDIDDSGNIKSEVVLTENSCFEATSTNVYKWCGNVLRRRFTRKGGEDIWLEDNKKPNFTKDDYEQI